MCAAAVEDVFVNGRANPLPLKIGMNRDAEAVTPRITRPRGSAVRGKGDDTAVFLHHHPFAKMRGIMRGIGIFELCDSCRIFRPDGFGDSENGFTALDSESQLKLKNKKVVVKGAYTVLMKMKNTSDE